MTVPMQYPEHEKMKEVVEQSQAIGEFLDWLDSQGVVLARWNDDDDELVSDYQPIEQRLAQYFGIDLDKVEAEKQAMLERLRSGGTS